MSWKAYLFLISVIVVAIHTQHLFHKQLEPKVLRVFTHMGTFICML